MTRLRSNEQMSDNVSFVRWLVSYYNVYMTDIFGCPGNNDANETSLNSTLFRGSNQIDKKMHLMTNQK